MTSTRAEQASAILRTIENLMAVWSLSDSEAAVLVAPASTRESWRTEPASVPDSVLQKLMTLIRLHGQIKLLGMAPAEYVRRETPAGGRVIDAMLSDDCVAERLLELLRDYAGMDAFAEVARLRRAP